MTRDILNFLQLSDRLSTGGQPTPVQLADLAGEGFEAVVNLALPTSDNALANEGELVTRAGLSYIHIPVKFEAPTAADFEVFRGVMRALGDRKVFVHCALNMRVSAFVYLYRILEEHTPVASAAADLHRIWEPDPIWRNFIQSTLANG